MNCVWPPTAIRIVAGSCDREHAAVKTTARVTIVLRDHSFIDVLPADEAVLEPGHSEFHNHHHDAKNQHARIDSGSVEVPLRLADDPTQTLRRRKILTDHS